MRSFCFSVKSMTLGVSRARRAARAPGPLRRAPLPSDPQKHRFRKVVLYSHESSGKIRYGQARYRTKIVSFGGCNWARNRLKEKQCKTSSNIFWRDRFWGLRQTHARHSRLSKQCSILKSISMIKLHFF